VASKGISVVIPNYNGRDLLEEILPSLILALKNASLPYEIIVSDDFSTDESLSFLKTQYPDIALICNVVNLGFSPTINKGIFATQYDYVLLLNSDVKLSPDYLKPLLRYFDLKDTFGVMGRIVGWEDDNIQDAAKFPSFHGAKIKTSGNYYLKNPGENDRLYSMYLSGANAFVSREKLQALGGFNEIFTPFYVEDFELSLRAWRLGWKCYYDHTAICRHRVSITIKSKNKKSYINTIYYRNKMFLHAMHLQGISKLLWYIQLIPETFIRLVTARWYYFQALKMFFSQQKEMKKSIDAFHLLANNQKQGLASVNQIVKKIHHSLKDKSIEQF
jgi:GT2 family glycosyltransferase